jgi:transcriptional regulator with XRE-family HTH domain
VTTLAERLERLFATIHPAGRGPYSNEEVAAAIQEQGGPTISGTYIWLLRKGQRDNPTKKHLEALAGFFGVPVAYFFDDEIASQLAPQLNLLAALRDSSVRDIALRVAELSPDSLDAIRGMIEQVRHLEARSNPRPQRPDPR